MAELRAHGDEPIATGEQLQGPEGYIRLDIADPEQVRKTLVEVRPDAVLHLAAISFVPDAERDFARAMRVNVAGTDSLCRTLIEERIDAKFLFVSSPEVYGIAPSEAMPLTENQPHRPANNYGLTKSFAEAVVERWTRRGLRSVILRPFNHIGPGQDERFAASSFAKQLAEASPRGKATLKVGNLEAKRDFTDVRDIVRGYRLALRAGEGVYQLCSGSSVSLRDLLDRLIAISGVEAELQPDPERMRPSDVPEHYGSNARALHELGWSPQVSLDQTLRELYNWWRARTELV